MNTLPKATIDKTGRKYGRLTVLAFDRAENHRIYWICQCECGMVKSIRSDRLSKCKPTQSCGCYKPHQKPKGEAAFNALYRSYQAEAVRRELVFSLTRDEFRVLINSTCHYCGSEPSKISKQGGAHKGRFNGGLIYNGIDRVNNSMGYMSNNVVACCEQCNKAKRHLTKEQFLEWVHRVCKHSSL